MKHKHRWQFVRQFPDYVNMKCSVVKEDEKIPYTLIPSKAEFICECGKIKVVEVKR